MEHSGWENIPDIKQALKDAWRIFEDRVMSHDHPNVMRIAWRAWFGPAPRDKQIK